ncbi:MAG TPA: SgcJ/EcaC family oxidoreductase, partial [Steroidobacteraceae bacterium]|nr:SgcJ/EcaC family oxidoreductase [Steroidobacteraceae bacterium]
MSELDQKFVAIIDDWVKAYEADDPERVIDLYADDAVVAVQGRATVNGRTEIAALLRDSFVRYDR